MPISRIAATQSARPAGPSSSLQLCSSALLSTAARSLVVAASSVVDALPQQREEQLLVRRRQLRLGRALQQGEDARAQLDGDAHDDALGDALDGSGARVEGGLVEMVGRLLEGREREDRLRHLGHAEARDAEDLATEGHHVSEEGHVAHVNVHAVVAHHVLDLVDDRRPRGLDSEALLHLHHVGRLGLCALDALDAHDRLQRRPLDQQPLARPAGGLLGGRLLALRLLDDDRARDALDTAHAHLHQLQPQLVHLIEHVVLALAARRVDAHGRLGGDLDVGFADLELGRDEQCAAHLVRRELKTQVGDLAEVEVE
mmetsp:Transcript_22549/g.66499  ORF Transcript_22549/g.66499 Transcript_22549/m.66499 type:complete len:314 (-) Transcript_22549:532-1473(-)